MTTEATTATVSTTTPATRSSDLPVLVAIAAVIALVWAIATFGYPLVIVLGLAGTAIMLTGIVVVTATGL